MEHDQPFQHNTSPPAEDATELTAALQPGSSNASSPSSPQFPPHPPAVFAFPRLNIDGSLPDLAAASSSYPPAPPAALSSLGAKAKMTGIHNDLLGDGSAIDSQYDMIDDISDISDDRETASLVSTQYDDDDEDGGLTPDGSIVDVQEEREERGAFANDAEAESTDSQYDSRVKAENELLDSFLSETLETPRQSFVRDPLTRRGRSNLSDEDSSPESSFKGARRILFVSDRSIKDDTISDVCLRIASCLLSDDQAIDNSISRFTRLPPTPAGIHPTSSIFVRVGEVELLVDHCVGAERRGEPGTDTYGIHIQDGDKMHTSVFTVGSSNSKIALPQPDLVIYYVQSTTYPDWFDNVRLAMSGALPGTITVTAPDIELNTVDEDTVDWLRQSDLIVSNEEFFHGNEGWLRMDVQSIMESGIKRSRTTPPRSCTSQSSTPNRFTRKFGIPIPRSWKHPKWTFLLPIFATILAVLIKPYLILLDAVDPAVEVTLRREALTMALIETTNSTDEVAAFNMTHLLPYPEPWWPRTYDLIPPSARYQGAAPNHILVSLPKQAASGHFLEPKKIVVQKKNTFLDFNQTQLIDGVYDITLHTEDASGKVSVTVHIKDPEIYRVFIEHDFGTRPLYRQEYQKAVARAINKDVAVARKNVKMLGDKVGLELTAGAAATRNVTTELAIYLARDLQVLANTAVSVFAKAAAASNETAASLKKELAVIQKDLIKFSKDVQKSVVSTADAVKACIPDKQMLKNPLARSRERALRIRDLIIRRTDLSTTFATKELSLRLKNMFKPAAEGSEKDKKLADVASSSHADSYRACRKAEKALTSASSAVVQSLSSPTTGVETAARSKAATEAHERKVNKKGWKKGTKEDANGAGKGDKKAEPAVKRTADRPTKKAKKMEKKLLKKGKKWPRR